MSAPSTPARNKRSEAASAQRFLLSPATKDITLMSKQEVCLETPPEELLRQYWAMPRVDLETHQNHEWSQSVRYQDHLKDVESAIADSKKEHDTLIEKKQQAMAFLSTVDGEIQREEKAMKTYISKQIGIKEKLEGMSKRIRAISFLLIHSKLKPFAKMALEEIRAMMEVEDTGKVSKLSYLELVAVLRILANMSLEENDSFVGDDPSEDNDYRGMLRTGKGNATQTELIDRVIRYLQVPSAPAATAATTKQQKRAALLAELAALDDEDDDGDDDKQLAAPPAKKARTSESG